MKLRCFNYDAPRRALASRLRRQLETAWNRSSGMDRFLSDRQVIGWPGRVRSTGWVAQRQEAYLEWRVR
jgi:hypothetical protein